MFCSNCGAKNGEGGKFCVNCGTALEETVAETKVEEVPEAKAEEVAETIEAAETAAETTVATETAQTTQSEPVQTIVEPVVAEEVACEEETAGKRPLIKKILVTVVVIALLAILATVGVKVVDMFSDEIDYSKYPVLYLKDDELNVRPEGKKASYELADADVYLYGPTYYGGSKVQLTEKGDTIFFADDLAGDYDEEFDLYYRKTKDVEGESKKIAKDVTEFQVISGKNDIVYIRDGKLCYNDLKNEKVIDKDVENFGVSNDGKKVFYEDEDSDYYICGFGKNDRPEKIDSEIDVISDRHADYSKIYYVKDEKLYEKELGKTKKKLASDIEDAFMLEDKIFVVKSDVVKYKYDDLITNDLDTSNLVDPESLVQPDYTNYDSYSEWSDAYDEYLDKYWEAEEAWEIYENVQDIEEYFNENPYEKTTYAIYELNGTKLNKIDENIVEFKYKDYNENTFYYKNADEDAFKKIKLSETTSAYDAEEKISEAMSSSKDKNLCVLTAAGNNYVGFEVEEEIDSLTVSGDGKEMYVLFKKEEKEEGELIKYSIGSSKLSGKKVVADDVESFTLYDKDVMVVYDKDEEATLIKNGKKTSLGEEIYAPIYEEGVLYYLRDYDNEDESGDLAICENGKVDTIVNDVAAFQMFSDKKIAYISDYDTDDKYGELYICNKKGKGKLVDEEVSCIVRY